MEPTTPLATKDQWLHLAVTNGLIGRADLAAAVSTARDQQVSPLHVLLASHKLTEDQAAMLQAEAAGMPYVEIADYQLDPAVLQLIPESVARKHQVLPLFCLDRSLTVAIVDPWNAVAIDALRTCTKLPLIQTVVGTPSAIRKAIDRHYSRRVVEEASKHSVPARPEGGGETSDDNGVSAAGETHATELSVAKLVEALLVEGLDARASDIHVEPDGEHSRVRFRIDGVLHEMKLLPSDLHETLCSRIKILASLDITEHRLPQDGRFSLTANGRSVDLRVSTYPTVSGENVVIRLLDRSAMALTLTDLGLAPAMREQLVGLIAHPHGMLLVTGPTGSGKTTTLYAALSHINTMAKNIVTIEDPVEYHLPLVRQTQVHVKAGLTFAAGLRSILRQDPDVIMVGEIRDQETAQIAVHAALTGHLVLSTLHTNDAVGAVARLLDMGVEPYLLASTLLGVVGQRLVRRVCQECREGMRPPQEVRKRHPDLTVLHRGRGCHRCRQSGFAGRLGVFEVLVIDDVLRGAIADTRSADDLKQAASAQGMRTMRQDGLSKVEQGLTTLEELDRVVPPDASASTSA